MKFFTPRCICRHLRSKHSHIGCKLCNCQHGVPTNRAEAKWAGYKYAEINPLSAGFLKSWQLENPGVDLETWLSKTRGGTLWSKEAL